MGRLSWYRASPRDFLDGTRGMAGELKGAYRLVLDLIYLHDGAAPDDDGYVAGQLGYDVRVWRRFKARLIELGKLYLADGCLKVAGDLGRWPFAIEAEPLPGDWAARKRVVLARDGEHCAYCGSTSGPFEVDHIVPRAKGGDHDVANLTVACRPCNRSKKDKLIGEWSGEWGHG